MLLTQNDYNNIKDWLKKNSEYIKDTEFPKTDHMTLEDEIVFLQNNLNKRLSIDEFSEYMLNLNMALDTDIDKLF
jgi:hypothetical protein